MPYFATDRTRRAGRSADDPQAPLVLTRIVGAAWLVTHVCPRAAELGLRPGVTLGQAQARVPQLSAAEHDPLRDRAVLHRLAQWALRFSPLVEPVEPDTLLVDITGCQRLFGGEERIVQSAVAGSVRQGFQTRGAIADTRGTAWALAVADSAPHTVVPPGQSSAFLAPLPPAALRIEPQTAARLAALGVRTIADLLMLPRSTLPARFGPQLGLRLQQALGEVFEGLTPFQPPDLPLTRRLFEHPIGDGQTLLSIADQLLAELFEQLGQRSAALRRLDCVLYYERARPRVVSIRLARASHTSRHVAALLRERLERTGWTPADTLLGTAQPTGVTAVLLIARQTARRSTLQADLFEPSRPDDNEALGCLIDRLATHLGYEAILRPQLGDDHQPEWAFRYVSITQAGCEPGSVGPPQPTASPATAPAVYPPPMRPRPVRLLARPIPIRVISLVPDGPPTWLFYQSREHVVAHAAGPERIETAWWRGPDVRRDYFRVTTTCGVQYWVFRDLSAGQWYLHGIFA